MRGEGRVPASTDQGLALSCYHLHTVFSKEMDGGRTIRAYVDEDLRHQAYPRFGWTAVMEHRCLWTNTSATEESERW